MISYRCCSNESLLWSVAEFTEVYVLVKHNSLFSWIPDIVRGFNQENMNIDKNDDAVLSSRLTSY